MTRQAARVGLAAGGCLLVLTACGPLGGADFGFPSQPPHPSFASVVTAATGSDDDDPMRGREAVIDVGSKSSEAVLQYYRDRFPADDGWSDETPKAQRGDDYLCLVNRDHSAYDEFVEVSSFRGSGEYAGPHRFLVWRARLHVRSNPDESPKNRCGMSAIWFPIAR